MAEKKETHSLEDIINSTVTGSDLKEIKRILYGREDDHELKIKDSTSEISKDNGFDVAAYSFSAAKEDTRAPRIVKVGLVQYTIAAPTTDPVSKQRQAIYDKVRHIIDAAGQEGVNVLCIQELWTMPYFFCTEEKQPWCEFAESAEDGPSTKFLREFCIKYNMVIISPILERDEKHGDVLWNTSVVIGDSGNVIGKHRKNHIPRVGVFKESGYFMEGNTGHPVFNTKYGKIAINICYGHLHPQNWMMFGINGAEIVFNPSATVAELTEPVWGVAARNAAVTNSYFACSINRVGTEELPNEFTYSDGKPARKDCGHFYGSSYVAAPDGSRTPGLSRVKDGLLIAEMDLNLCRQAKDKFCLRMTQRLDLYGESLTKAADINYEPQIISE